MADLMIDGVIGLDFLTGYNCSVNLCKQEIKFKMVKKGHFEYFRVVTPCTIGITAKREIKGPKNCSSVKPHTGQVRHRQKRHHDAKVNI